MLMLMVVWAYARFPIIDFTGVKDGSVMDLLRDGRSLPRRVEKGDGALVRSVVAWLMTQRVKVRAMS